MPRPISRFENHIGLFGALFCALALLAEAGGLKVVPPPEFSVAVNGATEVDVYRGWPLIIETKVLPPDTGTVKTKALLIAAPSGPWSSAIHLSVTNTQDQAQSWSWHLANSPTNSISIGAKAKLPKGVPKDPTAKTSGQLFWYLTPAETTQLTVGDYNLTGVLASTNSAISKAWVGQVEALPVLIHISDEPPLTPALESLKARSLARLDLIQGNTQQALTRLDDFLSTHSNDVSCLAVRAYLLESSGQTNDAVNAYSQALAAYGEQNPTAREPAAELSNRQRALMTKMLGLK